jgi:hypothetical protein
MPDPVLEILDTLAAPQLHEAAWQECNRKAWYFGNVSNDKHETPFWKMELDGVAAFDAIWEAARPRCEELAGGPLRVVRQYANGHTYGLGGSPHLDDSRPGTYTLLYYPMPVWEHLWEGETVFYDEAGEVALAVRPKPNRAVFFDSRIPHAGRAPSRLCTALRVTVAFKLERAEAVAEPSASAVEFHETRRGGAVREYAMRVPAGLVDARTAEQLAAMSGSIRLPGFRPGKIPEAILQQRYGARARSEAIRKLVAEYGTKAGPEGSLLSSAEVTAGAEAGDLQVQLCVTCLRDLPDPDFSALSLERLAPAEPDAEGAVLADLHLREQVLDYLALTYSFPIAAILVEREFSAIWKAAQEQVDAGDADRREMAAELREVAERRVRLGLAIAEIARRHGIVAADAAALENNVIAWIVSQARVTERRVTAEELRELAG